MTRKNTAKPRMMRHLVIATGMLLSGCGFVSRLATGFGVDARNLSKNLDRYDVQSVKVELAREEQRVCAGAGAPLLVSVEATKKKRSKGVQTLHTFAPGDDESTRLKSIDFGEFTYASPLGSVDEYGTFVASSDPFAALEGYPLTVTYGGEGGRSDSVVFEPSYRCWSTIGAPGWNGANGMEGTWGDAGGAGGAAGQGGDGGSGGKVVAAVTIVSTPLYDRVGLIRVDGDVQTTALFDLDQAITVSARGGNGGYGGVGGNGGDGNDGQTGGPGGPGGKGGNGGPGGSVLLVLDASFPELAKLVAVDVSGGYEGGAGDGGYGGAGGAYGDSGEYAPDGPGGPAGIPGDYVGADGRAEIRSGDITQLIGELPPGLTRVGA